MENARTKSSLSNTNTNDDVDIEPSKEFLMELKCNSYHETFDKEVADHIAKVLEILDLVNIPGVDSHQLRMKVFPLSLADDARQCVLSNNKWKKSNYKNPPNTATDTFFKSYEEWNELRQMKRKDDDKNDEQPNKKVCKAEKFEAIKYSLGPNEEYIAIRRSEYKAWERNEDSMSQIYQKLFQKKDDEWKVTRTE
nr:hypothetical protein [Tanacetum cinerariifolium]